jgi:cellulose synthase/poly-beta-1,6-N-acetylglucosamine synthase-like glycosyltransferase
MLRDDRAHVRTVGFSLDFGPPFNVDLRMAGVPTSALPERPFEIDGVPGGVAFARTDVLKEHGAFHPVFYMYVEDVELSIRLRSAGYGLACVPDARLVDLAAPHSYDQREIGPQALKNLISVYLLHAPLAGVVSCVNHYGVRAIASAVRRRKPLRPVFSAWGSVARDFPALVRSRWARGAPRRIRTPRP